LGVAHSYLAEIDRERGEMEPPPNLSSALRVFVLTQVRN